MTLWEQSDGAFAADQPGLHHLAFQVGAIEEVEAAEERVRELGGSVQHGGIVPHADGAHSGGMFFTDPDGIRLEIYAGDGAHGMVGAGRRGPDLRVLLGDARLPRRPARGPAPRGRHDGRRAARARHPRRAAGGRAGVPRRAPAAVRRPRPTRRARLGVGAQRAAGLRRHARRADAHRRGAPAGGRAARAARSRPARRRSACSGSSPETRRRMRVNGTGSSTATRCACAPSQVYSNCPKYIQRRHVTAARRRGRGRAPSASG